MPQNLFCLTANGSRWEVIVKKLFSEIPFLQSERLVLRGLLPEDADALKELTGDHRVYRYLPTFLFEKRYEDLSYVIDHLYDECLEESI